MGKHLLRAASVVSLIAVVVAFAPAARAEDKPEKKNRQQATGVIDSMDAKAKTVTIKKHDGTTVTFACGDKCKFATASKETAMMDDLKAGDKVVVIYAEEGGKKVAHKVGPAKAPDKASDKPAK